MAEAEEKKERARPELEKKKAQVKELTEDLSSNKNIVIIDLRKLPDKLLQQVRKELRSKDTKIKVAKSAVITRALEAAGRPKELAGLFGKPAAMVLGNELSPSELSKFFREHTLDIIAKPGQIAPEDIIVPEGETDLPPGPALSELKAAGIKAQIRGPKISVAKKSKVVGKGEEITEDKAKALGTLGFKPFKVKVDILLAYDGKYIYTPDILDISAESIAPKFVSSLQDAFNISVNAEVPTVQNIDVLLTQAAGQGMNTAVNGSIYTPQSIEQLLSRSFRTGLVLSDSVPEEPAAAPEEKPSEGAEEESAPKEGGAEAGGEEQPPEKKTEESPEGDEKPSEGHSEKEAEDAKKEE
ncbi:50S ribosomal protein L10 [Candidatus Micrarchaeota archaeon]|nr:50S ribosomal protein L10 [Candidatus Micrarchaeota archaeon]